MPEPDGSPEPQVSERYTQVQSDVLKLKAQLPEEAVSDIVREVLHRVAAERPTNRDPVNQPSRRKVESLCYALISDDPDEGAAFIHDARDDGAALDAIYLNYLAEAAVILGEWWDADHVSFHEVTIASSRIYAILREYSYLFVPRHPVEVKSAIFATVPGEIHTLGVRMAADLFGEEGWNVVVKTGRSHEALMAEITADPCRILGLSAGGAHSAPALARLVMALRVSRPDLRIFLSGQITQVASDLVEMMELDGATSDIDEARLILQRLWSGLDTPAGPR
ncbi:cobalamin-dependent protein [uncultured Roseobacter sp.]|uniref:cobalamin B12-binding domain-containing protein n=1 Tax=uncultured Roseobacter sp. TaxID=114847 RepID=UPI00261E1D4A|nr:cobalamin-dependent protein [uncultured Roseobacter sp.]